MFTVDPKRERLTRLSRERTALLGLLDSVTDVTKPLVRELLAVVDDQIEQERRTAVSAV
jgi:hypothetical protein